MHTTRARVSDHVRTSCGLGNYFFLLFESDEETTTPINSCEIVSSCFRVWTANALFSERLDRMTRRRIRMIHARDDRMCITRTQIHMTRHEYRLDGHVVGRTLRTDGSLSKFHVHENNTVETNDDFGCSINLLFWKLYSVTRRQITNDIYFEFYPPNIHCGLQT